MQLRFFVFCTALLFASLSTLSAGDALPETVQAWLKQRCDSQPGLSFAAATISKDGIQTYFYGQTQKDGKPVDGDTLYEIGSISKVYTASLLAVAASQNQLTENDPLSSLFPEGTQLPQFEGKAIRLVDLATHQSGLPRLPFNLKPKRMEDPYVGYDGHALTTYLAEYALPHAPGTTWAYSNLGAGLLGFALAQSQATTYEQLLQNNLLRPLGLTNTMITLSPEQQKRLAIGHNKMMQPVSNWDFDALAGAGAVRSTVEDLAAFVAAHLFPEDSPLGRALASTHRARVAAGSANPPMALGWFILPDAQGRVLWHAGQTGGYRAMAAFDPQAGFGVVLLTNSHEDVEQLAMHTMRPQRVPLNDVRNTATVTADQLADYHGHYQFPDGNIMVISGKNKRLYAKLGGQQPFEIFPESKRRFYYKVVQAKISFEPAQGSVDALVLHQGGRNRRFKRMPADWNPRQKPKPVTRTPEELDAFVGVYKDHQLGQTYRVRRKGQTLQIQVDRQQFIPVYAMEADWFFYKVIPARVQFHRDGDGVPALTFYQNLLAIKAVRE